MNQRSKTAVSAGQDTTDTVDDAPYCGIVMPISSMGGPHDNAHWERVRLVLDEAIKSAGYRPRIVSESEDIGIIHARIVQNLYDDQIVVCDVSGKNANVMFELGLRLAFDKPTIVIKDDLTDYSFDTSPIEHIKYRADLRFDDVRRFQDEVTDKIKATVARSKSDKDYSPFLGHFGKFKISGLETTEIDKDQFVLEQLKSIQKEIARLSNQMIYSPKSRAPSITDQIALAGVTDAQLTAIAMEDPLAAYNLMASADTASEKARRKVVEALTRVRTTATS